MVIKTNLMPHLPIALLLTASLAATQSPEVLFPCEAPVGGFQKEPVAVYQTAQRPGSLTVQSVSRAQVQFYLFDVEGNLVYQTRLSGGEEQIIEGLTAGT